MKGGSRSKPDQTIPKFPKSAISQAKKVDFLSWLQSGPEQVSAVREFCSLQTDVQTEARILISDTSPCSLLPTDWLELAGYVVSITLVVVESGGVIEP